MDASSELVLMWAAIGGVVGGLYGLKRRQLGSLVLDGLIGGCVAGSLIFKLRLGLPYHAGTIAAAILGAVAFVLLLEQFRGLDGGAKK